MTMYRYMALMWSRTDGEAARAAKFLAAKLHEVSPHAWSQAWDGAGLAIYHAGEHKGRMQTYRLQGERGAVLGGLFRNDYTSVVDDLDEFESRKCLETKGQHLIDNYWGRYVAFLNDPATGARYVMRDPTGVFPCFHTPFRGVTIYFSDMQDAANFNFLPFTVNWEYLKTNILLPRLQKTHTGLNEVGEVLPAECVEVTPFDRNSRFVWDPTQISQSEVIEDPEEAATHLRETVMSTIGALAGCHDRIVHNIGGLDSSIALACMAQAPKRPEITCINFYTKSPRGEERMYCRQVAEMYDVELVEQELDWRKADLSKVFSSNKLASPVSALDCVGLTNDVLGLAMEKEADALFYGVGGDNVFYQMPYNLGALDYIRCHGFGKHILSVVMDASRYGRTSLARTFSEMLREGVAPRSCYGYIRDLRYGTQKKPLVNLERVSDFDYKLFLHPLLLPNDRDLKGKYMQILFSAFFSKTYYDHWDTGYVAPIVRVYLTQPIIEACLRIPVWVLTHGGVDRGLARKAFKRELPSDVVRRFSKSSPQQFYKDVFENNIDLLRDILLDGLLVSEGILHRDKVEDVLSKGDLFLQVGQSEILSYTATEAWLKGWLNRSVTEPKMLEPAV